MKPLKPIIGLTLLVIACNFNTYSQVSIPFSQGFETGTLPSGWSEQTEVGGESWKYRNGGHNPSDPNWDVPAYEVDIARNPPLAHSGTYNAIFFKQSDGREKTKLITPLINLAGTTAPQLSLWVTQVPWTFGGTTSWDKLRIYYRTSDAAAWVLLLEILDPIYEWTEYRINLPNPTGTYQLAFEGETYWGYGTCIDDIYIADMGETTRWISEFTVNQATLNFVPTGTTNMPILRLDYKVYGNTGSPTLESIAFTSLNTNNADIATNGVKLYATSNTNFNTNNPIGTATNFNVEGKAIFNSLNYTLPDGLSHLWLTYDINSNATHNNRVDAKILANDMLANDTLYPVSEMSPAGYRVIYKTIYSEDFEDSHDWTLSGEFIVGTPNGEGGTPGNPDPVGAYSGTKAVFHPGNYEASLSESSAYKAISPTFNLQHYKNLMLSYKRFLNIEYEDNVSIYISSDDGSTWSSIWSSSTYISDFQWTHTEHSIASSNWRSPTTKIKFQVGPTSGSDNYSGLSFDDIVLTGEFISKDVGVTEWISPVTGCGHTSTETVVVKVANLGGADIVDPIPVQFSLNGGVTWITNTMNDDIPIGDTVTFTFTTKANLSVPGLRSDVRARTNLTGDQYTSNNQITTQIYSLPYFNPPVELNFKTDNNHWRSFGYPLWQHGIPSGITITPVEANAKSWITYSGQTYGSAYPNNSYTIFEDDFETEKGWAFTGEFERGGYINYDLMPDGPYAGNFFIGTDLTDPNYFYENNITEITAYTATSPPIDVSAYSNITINFYRCFEIAAGDFARIEISPDNSSWTTIWDNNGNEVDDGGWMYSTISIEDSQTYTNELRIRFSLYSTSNETVAEGLNIDDFLVEGDIVSTSPSYLESPCFDLSETVEPMVEVKLWSDTQTDVDGAAMEYTLDGGDTWVHLNNTSAFNDYWNWYYGYNVSALSADGWSGQSAGWFTSKQIMPAELVGQSDVKFRFKFLCDGKNNDYEGIAIQEFKVYELPFDLGVTQVLDPIADACEKTSAEPISVRIKNFGIRNMKVGETIVVKVDVDYEGDFAGINDTVTENIVLASDFNTNATMDYTFTKRFDLSIPGNYTITASTQNETDPLFFSETSNDQATPVIISVDKPFVDLGPDIYTVRPDTVLLDAELAELGITYAWYDNEDLLGAPLSTNPTYSVPAAGGHFWVELTNAMACTSVDDIAINKLIRDIGVSSFENPVSACDLTITEPLTVWVENFGTDTLKVGYNLNMYYQLGVTAPIGPIVWVLTEQVLPGDSIAYTFSGVTIDLENAVDYSVKAKATVDYDNDTGNDELQKLINEWGFPTFEFTQESIEVSLKQYTVDPATIGNPATTWEAYYWHNDESTDPTFVMTTSGTVTLTVYDVNMCPATDFIDIVLTFTSIGVGDVITPVTACEYPNPVTPQFKIQNLGTSNLSSGVEITYGYELEGTPIEERTYTTTEILTPNAFILTEFTIPSNISAVDQYTFNFYATYDGDGKIEDDEKLQVVNVYGYPSLELGEDVSTFDASYLLDAGAANTYLWSTDETTQTITVTETGNYSVTATNGGICNRMDDIDVTFRVYDYGITELLNPLTGCSQIDLQSISVKFENLGTETLTSGTNITFGYTINDGTPEEEIHALGSDLLPGNYLNFTFAAQEDFQQEGTYNVETYYSYAGTDSNASNDELNQSISVYPVPYTFLGNDTTITSGEIILDAGAGFAEYLWSDNSTNQTLTAHLTNEYWVQVTNEYGCTYSDTINIISLYPDFGVTAISKPNSACTLTNSEKVGITVKNYGNSNLLPGDTIPLELYVNGVLKAEENLDIVEEFENGDEINFEFITPLNLSATGDYTILIKTVNEDDVNNTNDSFSKVVHVWGNPVVTHIELDPNKVCIDGNDITLTGGNPTGGTYSGDGVSGTIFSPIGAGVGVHTITYMYTDPSTLCSSFKNVSVTVNDLPTVTLAAFTAKCENAPEFTLTGGNPIGGIYSGTGVSSGKFNPAVAGIGTHTITYTYTDGNNCVNSATNTIQVKEVTTVSFAALDAVCVDEPTFTLTEGSPAGGTYSGPGVSGGQLTAATAGAGTHTITYSLTNANGCTDTETSTIEVLDLPTVTLDPFADICISADPLTLSGGSPTGGTYSGTGVTNGIFDPETAGVGVHTITYAFTNAGGCGGSATSDIEVLSAPTVTLGTFTPVCQNEDPVTLSGGSPTGGTYSGTGIAEGIFNPTTAGAGTHVITYTYTDTGGNGCPNSATSNFEVLALPTVTLGSFSNICVTAEPLILTGGTPAGGTFSGTGVASGVFNPTTAGVGTHTITYSYTDIDGNGCSNSVTSTIEVVAAPTVTLGAFTSVCINTQAVTLSGGSPAGGTYSGTGVTDGVFDPATAGVGIHTITYTYSEAEGCSNSATSTIEVLALPIVTIGTFAGICINSQPLTLTGGLPSGGNYNGTGIASNIFSPTDAGVGVHTINYTYADGNGCSNSSSTTIEVFQLPTVTLSLDPVCLNEQPFTLTGGSPSGGTYSGTGVTSGEFDPAAAGVGIHSITYTFTDENGCSGSASADLIVNDIPMVDLGEDQSTVGSLVLDAGEGFVSYLWQDGSTEQTFTVTQTDAYSVTVTDENGCEGYDEVYITYFDPSLNLVVSELLSPINICRLPTLPVEVTLRNDGETEIESGAEVTIYYQVEQETPVSEIITLSAALQPQSTIDYTFTQEVALTAGSHDMSFWTSIGEEASSVNTYTAVVLPTPNLNLGPDTLLLEDYPYTLTSGVSNVTYLWSTGNTNSYITVTEMGTYWLTVTGSNLCQASDTIYIHAITNIGTIPGTNIVVNVFPNPAKDKLHVSIAHEESVEFTVEMFSPIGKKVHHSKAARNEHYEDIIDVSSFGSGVYFVKVSTNKGQVVLKVVVQK